MKQIQTRYKNTTKKINLDYLIDQTFRNINRLFISSFKDGENNPTRFF